MNIASRVHGRLVGLVRSLAPLALLVLMASAADAATYYVDIDGGSDTAFNGLAPTVTGAGSDGPFQTINRALQAAGNGDEIVILGSTYPESFSITQDNLTLTARPEASDQVVRLTGNITIGTPGNPGSVTLASATLGGLGGRFILNSSLIDVENGSINVGQQIATIGDGAEVTIERTNGTFSGTPIFASTPNVRYNGGPTTAGSELRRNFAGAGVNSDPFLEVAFTTGTAPRTLVIPDVVTLGGSMTSVNVAASSAISGAFVVVGDPVRFIGPGRSGSVTVADGGRMVVTVNLSLNGLTIEGTGVVDASGQTVTLFGDFRQIGNDTTFNPAGSLAFDGSGSYAFVPAGGLVVTNLSIGVGTTTNPTVTFSGDVTVTNLFNVAQNSTAALGGNLVNLPAAADSDVDGTVANGGVAFLGAGSTLDGTGVYDQILILGDDVTTVAGANAQFTGQMLLSGGSLLNAAATDVSPLGPNASVYVEIGLANGAGINRIEGGRFNGDNQLFNLTYHGTNPGYVVGSEFDTEYIRDLAVNADGLVDASGVGQIGPSGDDDIHGNVTLTALTPSGTTAVTDLEVRFPNWNVEINPGALSVGDDVLLTVAGGRTLELFSASNTLQGTIAGAGRLVLAGSAPGLAGSGLNNNASTASTIATVNGLLIAGNASATITGVELIDTFIIDGNTSSSLTLGLARDGGAGYTGAGNVTGTVNLDGALALTSDVEFQDDLTVDGAFGIASNDVVFNDADGIGAALLTLDGQEVSGDGTFRFLAPSTFHPRLASVPSVDVIADVNLISRGTVRDQLRLAAVFNADTASDTDANGDDYLTLAVDGTIVLADNGVVIGEADPTRQEVVLAGAFNFTNEQTALFSPFAVSLLGRPALVTFTSDPGAGMLQSLPEVGAVFVGSGSPASLAQATFNIGQFVQASGRFNLAGHHLEVRGNVTLRGTAPVVNLQDGTSANEDATNAAHASAGRASAANPYSELRFVGADNASLTVADLGGAAGAYVGSGIDLVLRKDADTTAVSLVGGALLFDDEFTPAGTPAAFVLDTPNDEMFVLERGVFIAGSVADRNTVYVNLDHENSIAARQNEAATDDGQGFAFRGPSTDLLPVAHIAGTIQKRITSNPNAPGGATDPGRVVNPLGDLDGEYAEYVLDFESMVDPQSFGRRTVRTSFVDAAPGGTLGLPIADAVEPGVPVDSTGAFHWLVTSDPTLGAETRFNVEARYDGHALAAGTSVDDLRLVRRQFGNEQQNPWTLAGTVYDNFLIDPTPAQPENGDEEPVVVVQGAQALLGPQGTLFTYGLTAEGGTPPPQPVALVQVQVVHTAPNAAPVDVYVGNERLVDNLAFGQATAYLTVNGTAGTPELTVTVASESSTSPTGGQAFTVTVDQSELDAFAFLVMDDGADDTPGEPYDVEMIAFGSTTASTSDTVEMFGVHASPDAPSLDIALRNGAPLFDNLAFGEVDEDVATGLDAAPFDFEVRPAGTTDRLYGGVLDLSSAEGERGLLIALGLQSPSPTQPARGFRLVFVRPTGDVLSAVNTTSTEEAALPTEFALIGLAPNPFRTTSSLRFDLPEAAEVSVALYDALGRRVMESAPATMAPGAGRALPLDGSRLASGTYVYRLTARGGSQSWVQTGQLTVVR